MSFTKTALSSIAAASLMLLTSASFADTVSGSFDVKVTVNKSCAINPSKAADVQFDTVDTTNNTAQTKQTILTVKCSKGTSYEIGLTPGNTDAANPLNTSGVGFMKRTSAGVTDAADQKIAYKLTKDSGGATAWGSTTGTSGNTVTKTGDSTAQTFTVYASVAGSAWNVEPGSYMDTVTVTVTY
ncbi:spore coat protein U domain-containing protein [Diaphorobacter ruginosibacter]|uniref:Csu type fimbrial protein n=1 Tax=Diaphorobacter ruginosibacter TaxID=1715720 RepID=UPI0033416E14